MSSVVDASPGTCTRTAAAASKNDLQNFQSQIVLNWRFTTYLGCLPRGLTRDCKPLDLGKQFRCYNLMKSSKIGIDLLQQQGIELVNLLSLSA